MERVWIRCICMVFANWIKLMLTKISFSATNSSGEDLPVSLVTIFSNHTGYYLFKSLTFKTIGIYCDLIHKNITMLVSFEIFYWPDIDHASDFGYMCLLNIWRKTNASSAFKRPVTGKKVSFSKKIYTHTNFTS